MDGGQRWGSDALNIPHRSMTFFQLMRSHLIMLIGLERIVERTTMISTDYNDRISTFPDVYTSCLFKGPY